MARKLGKPPDQRMAMLKNLTTDLLVYGKVETTEARAKEVRSIAENLITIAKKEKDYEIQATFNGGVFKINKDTTLLYVHPSYR